MGEPRGTPPGKSGARAFVALGAIVFGLVYLSNLAGGTLELIPDMVPLWGNLDELGAALLLLAGLRYLFGGNPR
mgnify:CR=1 FL=1